MIDRFGLLPEPVKTLFSITELKQQAAQLGIKKIEVHAAGGRILFNPQPNINAAELIKMIQTEAQIYKFDGADKLRFTRPFTTPEEKVEFVAGLLQRLHSGER
jgi:transcription-repair coupling factor (superfamily II helicase)